mgnify:CR=1 FL=1
MSFVRSYTKIKFYIWIVFTVFLASGTCYFILKKSDNDLQKKKNKNNAIGMGILTILSTIVATFFYFCAEDETCSGVTTGIDAAQFVGDSIRYLGRA